MSKSTPQSEAVKAMIDPEEATLTPLGTVSVGNNDGTFTVSIPKGTALSIGIDDDTEMVVSHDPRTNTFVYTPAEEIDNLPEYYES